MFLLISIKDNKKILSRIRANEKDNNININVQDLQYDWPMEQGVQKSALALDVVDMDLEILEECDMVDRMSLDSKGSVSKDIETNYDYIQDTKQLPGHGYCAEDQEGRILTREESMNTMNNIKMVDKGKFDAEKEGDAQETRGSVTNSVEQGIATRIKLLFDDDNVRKQKDTAKVDSMAREGVVVMDRVRELDSTVVVRRRARRGQAKESGVKVARIDVMFERSQAQKRKNISDGEPSKKSKFGD